MITFPHPGNGRAHRQMRQDKPQRHLRQRHPGRQDLLQPLHAFDCPGQILRAKISGAPVAFRKARLERHLPAQAAFIERHPRDHADIEFPAKGEQFILRRLIEDVVNDLHHVDQPCSQSPEAIFGLPPIDAQPKELDPSILFQFFDRRSKLRLIGPAVVPNVELQHINAVDAEFLPDQIRIFENMLSGKDVAVLVLRQCRPAIIGRWYLRCRI